MELGVKIAEGGCSDIYEWGEGKIVKLAKSNVDYYAMKREFDNHQIAYDSKLPTVKAYDLISLDGRTGIVFERFSGVTLKELLFRNLSAVEPDMDLTVELIQLSARCLYEIHRMTDVKTPYTQREHLQYSIQRAEYLTAEEKRLVIELLDTYPDRQCFCHGDPNPGNILRADDGQYVIIDWMDASVGHPAADLAEFIVMIRRAVLPDFLPEHAIRLFDTLRESIIKIFMDEYTRLSGITYDEVIPWLLPISARKLAADAISDAEKQLLIQDVRQAIRDIQSRQDSGN